MVHIGLADERRGLVGPCGQVRSGPATRTTALHARMATMHTSTCYPEYLYGYSSAVPARICAHHLVHWRLPRVMTAKEGL